MSRGNVVVASIVAGVAAACGAPAGASAEPADVGVDVIDIGVSARPVELGCSASTASTVAPSSLDAGSTGEQVRNILELHLAAGDFVGARVALCASDGTVIEVTAGTTSLDPDSGPVDPDVPWNIGSVTKTFVAVVVLQLAEQGLLDLDAGIDRFLPDLPGAERITSRQLLRHTSGLGEYLDQPAVRNDLQRPWTPRELIDVAEAAGRVGEPGGPYRYSNTNYVVLGEIIEQVTGNSWDSEVATRITEPLAMTHTSNITDERPPGYIVVDGSFVDATNIAHPTVGGAAGSLQSTGRDLLLFATALVNGTLLTPDSRAAMQTFIPGDDLSQFGILHGYGLGLEQYANADITVIGHLGTGEAHSAFVGYDPDHGTAVAVMTNTAVSGPQGIIAIEALTAASQTS
jgi:D-alanyl-D-alanine carboxypeptidase